MTYMALDLEAQYNFLLGVGPLFGELSQYKVNFFELPF